MSVFRDLKRSREREAAALAELATVKAVIRRVFGPDGTIESVTALQAEMLRERDLAIMNQHRVLELTSDIALERNMRVSAQRGLVAYMKEHGLADRIGYDPDTDVVVLQDIKDGKLPPRNDPTVIKQIAAAVVASKAVA